MSLDQSVLSSKLFSLRELNKSTSTINNNKIAIRHNDEVFFAYGSTIRASKISASPSYKLLDIPSLKFEIQGLLINSSGSLLAIYNESNILIASLPSSLVLSSNKDSLIPVKAFEIAPAILSNTKILKLIWNKVSRFDSSLVVLTDDGIIRTFDLNFSLEQPESVYDLSSPNKNKFGLSDNSITEPVSISFGSSERLSGALTLYVVNREGDIYSIYPFLPKSISVSKEAIEEIVDESVPLTNSILDSDGLINEKKQAINQLKLVNKLWKQVPVAQKEVRGVDELLVLDSSFVDSFYVQGPFAIQPYPEVLYDDDAVDILTISSGIVDLIVVSFAHNGFALLYPDSTLKMKWEEDYDEDEEKVVDDDSEGDEYPALTLLELKSPKTKGHTHISSFSSKSFLVQNGSTIYETDLSPLIDLLCDSLSNNRSERFLESISNARTISTPRAKSDFIGSGILKSITGESYSLILEAGNVNIWSDDPKQDLSLNGEKDEEKKDLEYKTLLGPQTPELPILLKQLKDFLLVLPKNYSNTLYADENSLSDLNAVSQQVLKKLIPFHKLGLEINYRLSNQESELNRQIIQTYELSNSLKSLQKTKETTVQSVDEAVKRQDQLNERFEKLVTKLQHTIDLPISSKEKQWFKEIQNLTYSFNKAVKRNVVLSEQLNYMKSEIKSQSNAVRNSNLQEEDWSELNKVLKDGKKLIEQTSKSLEENLTELDEQLGYVRL